MAEARDDSSIASPPSVPPHSCPACPHYSQNDLDEFYALMDFAIPNCLGDRKTFDREYNKPILAARDLDASEKEARRATRPRYHGFPSLPLTAPLASPRAAADATRAQGFSDLHQARQIDHAASQ